MKAAIGWWRAERDRALDERHERRFNGNVF